MLSDHRLAPSAPEMLETRPPPRQGVLQDLPSGLAGEALALSRQLALIEVWEEVGLASKALRLMEQELGPELRHAADERLSLVTALLCTYRSYCSLLYAGLLPPLFRFAEWVGRRASELVLAVLRQWANASSHSLREVFSDFLRPCFSTRASEKHEMLLSFLSSKGYHVVEGPEEHWEESFVSSVATVLSGGDLAKLEEVAVLAEASLPTQPRDQRCIGEVRLLVRLVTEACLAFDDLDRGLPVMWRLVVTTPEAVIPGMETEFRALDGIQAALGAAEVLRAYLPLPPLSLLSRDHRRDRLLETELVRDLLRGLGHLPVDLSQLKRFGLAFVRESSSSETTRTLDLREALLVRMCGILAGRDTVGASDIERLIGDIFELRRGLLAELPGQWVGAVTFNAIIHHCPMELVYAIVDDLLRPNQAVDEDPGRALMNPFLESLGVDAKVVECLLMNRVMGIFDSAVSCHDPGNNSLSRRQRPL